VGFQVGGGEMYSAALPCRGFELFVVVLFDVPCRESEMERSWMEGFSTEGRLGFPIACLWL
jgi:hypothetical protein